MDQDTFQDKLLGCWMGKNIGGTLGAPYEWFRQVNDVTFYDKDYKGEPLPNDDLDIQLLWLVALEENGPDKIDSALLADYWCLFVTPHWAEYGVGKSYMRAGILPPLSAMAHNPHKDSCGAFIRSEIWACINPGSPDLAAHFAYQDGCLDHGDGEGMFAEVFCAVLESMAFVEKDLETLIPLALTYIPDDSGVTGAVRCVLEAWKAKKTWLEARNAVLEGFRGSDALGGTSRTSEEDQARGFHEGPFGYDAPSNVAITLIGMLWGEGDFEKTLCTAVNCGEDTDCTAATAGALFGILHGYKAIPEKWITPIGHGIKTVTLNLADMCDGEHRGGQGFLGPFGTFIPSTIDNLAERTHALARQLALRYRRPMPYERKPAEDRDSRLQAWQGHPVREGLLRNQGMTWHRFPFFDLAVDYGGDVFLLPGQKKTIRLHLHNKYRLPAMPRIRWYLPDHPGENGWRITPSTAAYGFVHTHAPGLTSDERVFEVESPADWSSGQARFVVEVTLDGRPTVFHVPVVLLAGSLADK